ncbi:GAF domain-containing protein [Haloimpatiens sp. FM7330]|uniref:GAF domain-containing protein n=1 Tax=Haloimpatiens sp. FM7330 TaxID=3298610 RepID=UPI00362A15BF
MDTSKVKELLNQINSILEVDSVGMHEIYDNRLHPVYTTDNPFCSVEQWKSKHAKFKVKVSEEPSLKRIMNKEIVCIEDTSSNPESSKEFFEFGIKSLVVFPMIKNNKVIGLVTCISISKQKTFKKEKIVQAENKIKEFCETL